MTQTKKPLIVLLAAPETSASVLYGLYDVLLSVGAVYSDMGVLHRDIKPANIMLEPDGQVWLGDFGIARSTDCTTISHTGDVVGTLCYMAPEQLAGKPERRSDIYSLGLTLFELLTRSRAFEEADPRRLAYRIARGEVPSAREVESHRGASRVVR